ncbi:hypothetical protein RFI_28121 [Reticulomyxa filosa]|uniref:RNA-dependent RNA polymerase n=1 Tax=Reticulomyxa filosa TaxID=46433 RepID=X6M721_RETFI|nr:hypothetical protein RFI_28121 [Reticulomyxa filosa]|eukprot:ETO09267.1 hypothetical protein RFI_28121 [Reticulomyxa filosa]
MFRLKQYSPPDDFLRIEFVDELTMQRSTHKDQFKLGHCGRLRAWRVLEQGLPLAGVLYEFLFFGNKQVRDAKTWMKAELVKGYDANRVRADIARLSNERNIGKKMDRFHLFMSKGTPGAIYDESDIEIIEDIRAKDGKLLTDGCSLILEADLEEIYFTKYVASMLVRIGGAKTQMMSASAALMEKLVREDAVRTNRPSRNFKPRIILTKSCHKFMTDTQKQLEIKKACRSSPCMMNREFVNHVIFHNIIRFQGLPEHFFQVCTFLFILLKTL